MHPWVKVHSAYSGCCSSDDLIYTSLTPSKCTKKPSGCCNTGGDILYIVIPALFCLTTHMSVNPGGLRGRNSSDFELGSWGLQGVVGESWTGLGKYYIVFWTESMLESDYFLEKRGKMWKFLSILL